MNPYRAEVPSLRRFASTPSSSFHASSVTAVAYDRARELLWTGLSDGVVMSRSVPNLSVYTSFRPAGPPSATRGARRPFHPIAEIIPCSFGIGTVTSKALQFHAHGGLTLGAYFPPEKDVVASSAAVNAAETFASLSAASSVHLYDLSASRSETPLHSVTLSSSFSSDEKTVRTSAFLDGGGGTSGVSTCGTSAGEIHLFDWRTRHVVTHVVRAFYQHNEVKRIACDGHRIAACGFFRRKSHSGLPDDVRYDPSIKMYDVRRLDSARPLAPLQFCASRDGPCDVTFISGGTLVATSPSGAVQTSSASFPDRDRMFRVLTPERDGASLLTCASFSVSGDYAAFGTSSGASIVCTMRSDATNASVNANRWVPQHPRVANTSASLRGATCAQDISFLPTVARRDTARLLGRLDRVVSGASLGKRCYAPRPCRRLAPVILSSCTDHTWIDNTKMGFKPNTLVFGHAGVYVDADPREGIAKDRNDSTRYPSELRRQTDERERWKMVPEKYRLVLKDNTFKSRHWHHRHAQTTSTATRGTRVEAGMGNDDRDRYVNSTLQVLFHTAPFRNAVLSHICDAPNCLTCELSFLFHMLVRAREVRSTDPVRPSNFLRCLRLLPESIALGLSKSSPTMKLQHLNRRVEAFYRFVLDQVRKECVVPVPDIARAPHRPNDVGSRVMDMFGLRLNERIDCQDGRHEPLARVATPVVTALKPFGTKTAKDAMSFTDLLSRSVRQDRSTRGWCERCSEYRFQRHTRLMMDRTTTLPQFLSLTCSGVASTLPAVRSFWTRPNALPRFFVADVDATSGAFVVCWEGHHENDASDRWEQRRCDGDASRARLFELCAVVSCISASSTNDESDKTYEDTHTVCHVLVKDDESDLSASGTWVLFNDTTVEVVRGGFDEVCDFRDCQRVPCVLQYVDRSYKSSTSSTSSPSKTTSTPASISPFKSQLFGTHDHLALSRSEKRVRHHKKRSQSVNLPGKGDLIAIDCEFVALSKEVAEVDQDGRRVVVDPMRLGLGRVSVLDGRSRESTEKDGVRFIDDYIISPEPVVDYLTRFSGLRVGDLDPSVSPHRLVPLKTVYLKLRHLVDRGCVFVGHGLFSDFRVINLFVPPSQIKDTVELFRLPGQRKISLRFLAAFVLKMKIQDDTHDSVVDARIALMLYRKYVDLTKQGPEAVSRMIHSIYDCGRQTKWKRANGIAVS